MTKFSNSLKILNYYHTSIRNVGLYTSISFASLAYSRHHRDKNFHINISLILISLAFTVMAYIIADFLLNDIEKLEKTDTDASEVLEKWLIIPKMTKMTNIIVGVSTSYVLYKQLSKTRKTN